MTNAIKKCPFCGGKAVLMSNDAGKKKTYYVMCHNCCVRSPVECFDKNYAIKYWNKSWFAILKISFTREVL